MTDILVVEKACFGHERVYLFVEKEEKVVMKQMFFLPWVVVPVFVEEPHSERREKTPGIVLQTAEFNPVGKTIEIEGQKVTLLDDKRKVVKTIEAKVIVLNPPEETVIKWARESSKTKKNEKS